MSIERKSLQDLVQCCGLERDRFKREIPRLRGYRCKAVIVEAPLADVMAGSWRGRLKPTHVLGSVVTGSISYAYDLFKDVYNAGNNIADVDSYSDKHGNDKQGDGRGKQFTPGQ